jgi:hypothetical protein
MNHRHADMRFRPRVAAAMTARLGFSNQPHGLALILRAHREVRIHRRACGPFELVARTVECHLAGKGKAPTPPGTDRACALHGGFGISSRETVT